MVPCAPSVSYTSADISIVPGARTGVQIHKPGRACTTRPCYQVATLACRVPRIWVSRPGIWCDASSVMRPACVTNRAWVHSGPGDLIILREFLGRYRLRTCPSSLVTEYQGISNDMIQLSHGQNIVCTHAVLCVVPPPRPSQCVFVYVGYWING